MIQGTYLQNRNRLTDFENKLRVTRGETVWGGKIKSLETTHTQYYI